MEMELPSSFAAQSFIDVAVEQALQQSAQFRWKAVRQLDVLSNPKKK